jgi:predicted metal-dependent hydrolase
MLAAVSLKSQRIAGLVESFHGQDLDARYLGFFRCFNEGLYFEAHEVLEDLWLPDRHGPNGAFYKGLIQLAGAFVHWQRSRLGPAAALFKLARGNLALYPALYERLNIATVLELIDQWLETLGGQAGRQVLTGFSGASRPVRFQLQLED